jgi:peptidoglycan/xylan/chitin deacetylase (PgdA/CDA1 family)
MHGDGSGLAIDQAGFDMYPAGVRSHLMRIARKRHPLHAQDLDSLVEALKEGCHEGAIQELIRKLANATRIDMPLFEDTRFFMDWDQVCKMASAGMEIGSHGCSHRVLTRLSPEESEDEIVRSKLEIERRTGQRVRHFAFPEGAANRDLIARLGKAGYQTACLCASRPNESPDGCLALRRKGMHEGVSARGDGSFSEELLALWLSRGR